MEHIIKKIPLSLAGVMLGIAALGNLLLSYSKVLQLTCGVVSAIVGVLLLIKLIMYPGLIKEDFKNPVMASVAGTFPMALMLLSVYSKPYIGGIAKYIWLFAIILHVVLMFYFTVQFVFHLDITKIVASYYIVYVGIAVASITAPAYEMFELGTFIFWFGFVSLLILLVLVTYRYVKYNKVAEPLKPLFCIYAAPTSLCLAGYNQSVENKSLPFIVFMAIMATCIYIIVLINLPKFLKLKFYPSYAAFTFPFVISAIAMKMTMVCLTNMGKTVSFLNIIVLFETLVATILVIYTFIRFFIYLLQKTDVK